MDVVGGGIDVRHHPVDGGIGIKKQARSVSTDGVKATDRVPEGKKGSISLGHRRLDARRMTEGGTVRWRQARKDFSQLGDTTPANIDLAKEQVGEHASRGSEPTTTTQAIRDAGARLGRSRIRARTASQSIV